MLQGKSAHCFKNKHVKKSKMHVEGNYFRFGKK